MMSESIKLNPEFFVFRVPPFMKKLVVSKMMCDRPPRSLRSRLPPSRIAVEQHARSALKTTILLLHDFPRKEVSYRGHAEHGSPRASEIRVLLFRLDSGRALFLKSGSHTKSYHP